MNTSQTPINIGKRDRIQRRVSGIAFAVISLVGYVIIFVSPVSRWWGLGLLVPLFMSLLGFRQASAGT